MYDYIIYDFDGTLSDTYPIFAEALVNMLNNHNIENDYNTVYSQLKKSVGYALDQYDFGMNKEQVRKEYAHIHHELGRQKQQAFPEAAEILQYAIDHGKKNYLYTHTGKFVYEMLDKMGLSGYFEFVIDASYNFPTKPAPDALIFLFEKCNIDKSRAIMIGDRDIDINAAHAAGIHGCLFDTENYYPECDAEHKINSLLDLKKIM